MAFQYRSYPVVVLASVAALVTLCEAEPLLLTPLLRSRQLEKARQLSHVAIQGASRGYSGFFSVPSASGRNTNHLFFWFQPCLDDCDAKSTPFVQFFNGGPGVPSTSGATSQIGNWYSHDATLKLHERCFSWCRGNNCLFVDQPVMTGFSFQTNDETGQPNRGKSVEYTQTTPDAMEQVHGLLVQFLQVWPEYQSTPYYVQGLSYGGMYVPWMAYTIWQNNQRLLLDGETRNCSDVHCTPLQINLKGMAVGDPVMSWPHQMPTYASTLYGMGVIMEDERDELAEIFANASNLLSKGDCWGAFRQWNRVFNDDGGSSCQPHCEFLYKAMTGATETENVLLGSTPHEQNDHNRAFLLAHGRELHYSGSPTAEHPNLEEGGEIYLSMVRSGDMCNSSAWLYTTLFLEAGIDVVVYTGTADPLLGPPTTEAGVKAAWDYAREHIADSGATARNEYYSQKKTIWAPASSDNVSYLGPAGYARCLTQLQGESNERRFCYVVVRNAGHDTAVYQPRAAFDMNERYLHRRTFAGSDITPNLPTCLPCGGAPPFAGSATPGCATTTDARPAGEDGPLMIEYV